jgi:outer membrane lipoprotein-sorting protein
MRLRTASILAVFAVLASTVAAQAQQPQDELAAQVRIQGFACDKAQGATRDKKRSKPDYAVWVLKCSNATYRVSRAPDMAAKIEPLR